MTTFTLLRELVARSVRDRAAIRELRTFSTAQLWDLGITRDQIAAYVAGRVERKVDVPRRPQLRLVVNNPAMPCCAPCCAMAA